jgi:hypothetical protein
MMMVVASVARMITAIAAAVLAVSVMAAAVPCHG